MASSLQDVGLKIVLLGVREFQRNTDIIEKNIAEVNRSMDKTDTSAKTASRGIEKYSQTTEKASSKSKSLAVETSSLSTKLSSLGSKFTMIGAGLTAAITVPLNLLRNQLIGIGIEFEDAFANVSKTVDGISDDFGNLTEGGENFRKKIIDLSLELPVSVNELARVAAAGGQVGITFEKEGEILLEFTKIATQMGIATNISSEDAAIAMARVANIYGVATEDMIEFSRGFSSSIVALGNTTAATEQEILNMTMRLAPAASLAGITADEVLALAASMTEMGIQAEAGGTAMSTILLQMGEASRTAGSSTKAFDESNKQMQEGLVKLKQLLNSGVTDLTELEFALQGTGLNLEGVGGMVDNLGGDFDSVNISIQKTQNTLTKYNRDLEDLRKQQGELRAELAAGTITQDQYNDKAATLSNRYMDIQTSIANAELTMQGYNSRVANMRDEMVSVDDIIRHVSMNTMMDLNAAMEESSSKTAIFADILGVSEEQFAAAFGAAPLETLQRFLMQLADLQDAGLVTEETLTELGFSGIRVRAVINTLGPNMENLTGNVELSNEAWVKQTALQVEVQKKFATTKAQIQLVKNAFNALGIAVFDYVKPAFDAALKSTAALITTFKDFFQASDANAKMISNLFIAASLLGPALIAVGVAMKSIAVAMKLSGTTGFLGQIMTFATSPVLVAGITAVAGAFWLVRNNIFNLGDLFDQIVGSISYVVDSFKTFVELSTVFKPALEEAFKSLKSGDIKNTITYLQIAFADLAGFIEQSIVPKIEHQLVIIKARIIDVISSATRWLAEEGIPLFFTFVEKLRDVAYAIVEKLGEWGKAFVEWVAPYIPQIIDTLGTIAQAVFDWILSNFTLLVEKLQMWGKAFVEWINPYIPEILKELARIVVSIIDWIIATVPEIVSAMIQWTEAFVSWVIDVGPKIVQGIMDALNSLVAWITDIGAKEIIASLGTWTAKFVEWIIETAAKLIKAFDFEIGYVIGWIVGFIIKAAAALIYYLGVIVAEFYDWIGDVDWYNLFNDIVYGIYNFLKGFIIGLQDGLGVSFLEMLEAVGNFIIDGAVYIGEAIWEFFEGIFDWIVEKVVDPVVKIGAAIVDGLTSGIEDGWNSFWGWITGLFEDFVDWILGFFIISSPSKVMFDIGKDIVQGIWDGIKYLWNTFIDYVSGNIEDFVDNWTDILSDLWDFGVDAIQFIWDGIKSLWVIFVTWMAEKIQQFLDNWKNILEDLWEFGKDAIQFIWDGITFLWGVFIEFVIGIINTFLTSWKDILSDLWEFGKDAIQKIWDGITIIWNTFLPWVQGIAGDILSSFVDIAPKMYEAGKELGVKLYEGLAESLSVDILDIATMGPKELGNFILDELGIGLSLGSPSKEAIKMGEYVTEGLAIGMLNGIAQLKDVVTEVSQSGIVAQLESSLMLDSALGSTVSNSQTAYNTTNSQVFSPTINGVPMQDEVSAGRELVRAWRMAQVTGNVL